eukprot:TRINITY_DN14002_c0_g1_i1.p1 TRINITY_DN14002_c0_g1~~TRINITY_DN14002_c0_g1_i1.p1  ORF type:complete len:267 (-),score=37.09 TRINITY_DN14002_c0_g1_i1:799-1599(-)
MSGLAGSPSLNVGHLRQIKLDIESIVQSFREDPDFEEDDDPSTPYELLAMFGRKIGEQVDDAERARMRSLSEASSVRLAGMTSIHDVDAALEIAEGKLALLDRVLRLDSTAGMSATEDIPMKDDTSDDESSDIDERDWAGKVVFPERLREHLLVYRLFLRKESLLAKKRSLAIRELECAAAERMDTDTDDIGLGGIGRSAPRSTKKAFCGDSSDEDAPPPGLGQHFISGSFSMSGRKSWQRGTHRTAQVPPRRPEKKPSIDIDAVA